MTDGALLPPNTLRREHWERAHAGKSETDVSWWQPVPALSLGMIERASLAADAAILDVGGGWSALVDGLVGRGHSDVTVVDLSATALAKARARLDAAAGARFVQADVLDLDLGRRFALWHDRAVFHFLVDEAERDDYRASLARALEPGGWLVVATFGPDGPTTCSGLPIVRYTHEALAAQFPDFDLVATAGEDHLTPWGTVQQFTAVLLRHRG